MKRFHVNLTVASLPEGVRFYAALFETAPVVLKDDYAKWMLDDPRINFAISERGVPIALPGFRNLHDKVAAVLACSSGT
jgi:hypothetical protein